MDIEKEFEVLWTTQDICDYLQVDRRKVYEMYKISTFPKVKVGKEFRTPKLLFFKWLKKYNKIADL